MLVIKKRPRSQWGELEQGVSAGYGKDVVQTKAFSTMYP